MSFKDRLQKGYAVQRRVAHDLLDLGLPVQLPPLRIRPTFEERADYSDDGDIFIFVDGEWRVIEVKGRTIDFTGVEDYPFETIFTERKGSMDKRGCPAYAYIVESKSGHRVVLCGADADDLSVVNKGWESFYSAPSSSWVDWDEWASSVDSSSGSLPCS